MLINPNSMTFSVPFLSMICELLLFKGKTISEDRQAQPGKCHWSLPPALLLWSYSSCSTSWEDWSSHELLSAFFAGQP